MRLMTGGSRNRYRAKAVCVAVFAIALCAVMMFVSCGGARKNMSIRVGSKSFTENRIIAELYALAVEESGLVVERRFDMGDTEAIHADAYGRGPSGISLYPEYVGSGWLAVLKYPDVPEAERIYREVRREYPPRFMIEWLEVADNANCTPAIAVKAALKITKISELQARAADINFASDAGFEKALDGFPPIVKKYGEFAWKSSVPLSGAEKYAALDSGAADAIAVRVTDAWLAKGDYVLLEDDLLGWPPFNVGAVILRETLRSYVEELQEPLNNVTNKLDLQTLIELVTKVDIDGQNYVDVAKEFYTTKIKG